LKRRRLNFGRSTERDVAAIKRRGRPSDERWQNQI
jgi:hypothetical protein